MKIKQSTFPLISPLLLITCKGEPEKCLFEETFYTPKKENEGKEQENAADSAQESDQELLMKLLAKPEMAALLKTLAKGL